MLTPGREATANQTELNLWMKLRSEFNIALIDAEAYDVNNHQAVNRPVSFALAYRISKEAIEAGREEELLGYAKKMLISSAFSTIKILLGYKEGVEKKISLGEKLLKTANSKERSKILKKLNNTNKYYNYGKLLIRCIDFSYDNLNDFGQSTDKAAVMYIRIIPSQGLRNWSRIMKKEADLLTLPHKEEGAKMASQILS